MTMLWMICQKCGWEQEESGLLSQKLWIWPLFAAFPSAFIGYYVYSLTAGWPGHFQVISAGILFVGVMVAASVFLRMYCRNVEFERFRRRRCPQCQHTKWNYREGSGPVKPF